MPPTNSIFISYRRSDSSEFVGRIYDFLSDRFGNKLVFKDVDSIPLGIDFRTHLNETIDECLVLIVVIGPTWLEVLQARLNQSDDWVRTEISAALERGIPVIPLLVGGAQLPEAKDLPEDLQDLAYRNATTARPDPDFRPDMSRLIQALEAAVGSTPAGSTTRSDIGALHVPDKLSGDEYDELVEALISAFINEESLALMVKRALRQPLNLITQGASNYEATVDSLVTWAESKGKLTELVEGALKRNAGNFQLNELVQTWRK